MKKTLLLFLVTILTLAVNAEVIIYRTYEDYQNNIGEKYDDYNYHYHVMGKVRIVFTKDGKNETIKCDEMWGFKYGDKLFRTYKKVPQPVCVISTGKICYYENGLAYMDMIKENKTTGQFSVGYTCLLSKDLNSEICPLPTAGIPISDAKKLYKNFKKENPQYSSLFECIDKNTSYGNVRDCMAEFEKEQ